MNNNALNQNNEIESLQPIERKDFKQVFEPVFELIKWLAVIAMFIDHAALFAMFVDKISFETYEVLRAIGRFAFITFGFLLAYNLTRYLNRNDTKSIKKYQKGLLIFAFISEIFYQYAWREIGFDIYIPFNIFFNLLATSFVITEGLRLYRNYLNGTLRSEGNILIPVALIIVSLFMIEKSDYGFLGAIYIYGFVVYFSKMYNLKNEDENNSLVKTNVLFILFNGVLFYYLTMHFGWLSWVASMLSLIVLMCSNKIKLVLPRINKWFYYWFYPLHLVLLKWIFIGF